jgi:SAM-dependent MidA family methyltransferase
MQSNLLRKLEELQMRHGGWIPWREFMALALYDEDFGYYGRRVEEIGRKGDFTTAPVVSSLLAQGLVGWVKEWRRREPGRWRGAPWIEVGAGSGALAVAWKRAFRRHIPWWERMVGGGMPYWIVEVSPGLRRTQEKALGRRGARWFGSVAEALRAAGGRAVLFSNELVDAMPCSAWERRKAGWEERGVVLENDGIREVTRPGSLPDSSIWQAANWEVGQRVETHELWRAWLAEWQAEAKQVRMLTIDYGTSAEHLLRRRPGGTLRAYWRHQRLEGSSIYARVGQQDLTADVNVTDLLEWGTASGWSNVGWQRLADFLRRTTTEEGRTLEEKRLLDPDDAGGAFFVLEQGKGLARGDAPS